MDNVGNFILVTRASDLMAAYYPRHWETELSKEFRTFESRKNCFIWKWELAASQLLRLYQSPKL